MIPIDALALVCNIMQLVDTAIEAVNMFKEIYERGSLDEHDEIGESARQIVNANEDLEDALKNNGPGTTSTARVKRLQVAASDASQAASRLKKELNLLNLTKSQGKRDEFKSTLTTLWKREQLRSFEGNSSNRMPLSNRSWSKKTSKRTLHSNSKNCVENAIICQAREVNMGQSITRDFAILVNLPSWQHAQASIINALCHDGRLDRWRNTRYVEEACHLLLKFLLPYKHNALDYFEDCLLILKRSSGMPNFLWTIYPFSCETLASLTSTVSVREDIFRVCATLSKPEA